MVDGVLSLFNREVLLDLEGWRRSEVVVVQILCVWLAGMGLGLLQFTLDGFAPAHGQRKVTSRICVVSTLSAIDCTLTLLTPNDVN